MGTGTISILATTPIIVIVIALRLGPIPRALVMLPTVPYEHPGRQTLRLVLVAAKDVRDDFAEVQLLAGEVGVA
jgi:hypothetical protein